MIHHVGKPRPTTWLAIMALILLSACSQPPVPKPKGYLRIDFPPKSYRACGDTIPFHFMMPTYGTLEQGKMPYAYNLVFPQYKATLYLTYYNQASTLGKLMEDSRQMVYQHTVKADAIKESMYQDSLHHVWAMVYDLQGDVASAVQFYATDSVAHFLRGALYFYCEPNADSLAPIVAFFREDVVKLLETLRWSHS